MSYGTIFLVSYAIDYYRRHQQEEVKISRLKAELAQAELQVTEAQLQALKMQLHPHFLFNTLNSISALLDEDIGAADQMLARLGDLLRMTLENSIAKPQFPLVIFVTAYDQYALRAFEVSAVDYLVKPFDRTRFEKALHRAKSRLASARGGDLNRQTLALLAELTARSSHIERLVIKAGGRAFFLKTEEIDWIEAEGKYVRLHAGKESYLLREAIGSMESHLDPKKFPRIHRLTIVNIDRVRELQPWFHNEYRVILQDGTELMLSRGCRKRQGELLGSAL